MDKEEDGKKGGAQELEVVHAQTTTLEMKYCNEVVDKPDFKVCTPVTVGDDSAGLAEADQEISNPPKEALKQSLRKGQGMEQLIFLFLIKFKM